MALGGKTSKKFYVTSGGGADEINSTRKTALDAFNTADAAAGYKQLVDDNTLGPLIVNLQEMQDDIDELRRFVDTASELRGKISPLPLANGGTGTATQTDTGIPFVDASAGTIGTSANLQYHHDSIFMYDPSDTDNWGKVGVGANGSMNITSYDDVRTSANITIESDGYTNIDSAANIILDSAGDIELKYSGSAKGAFKLDQVGTGCEIIGIQQRVVDISEAEMNAISTANSGAGYTIIPALGNGLIAAVHSCHVFTITDATIQNGVRTEAFLSYNGIKSAGETIFYARDWMYRAATNYIEQAAWNPFRGIQKIGTPGWGQNAPVTFCMSSSPSIGSINSVKVAVTFSVIKL